MSMYSLGWLRLPCVSARMGVRDAGAGEATVSMYKSGCEDAREGKYPMYALGWM